MRQHLHGTQASLGVSNGFSGGRSPRFGGMRVLGQAGFGGGSTAGCESLTGSIPAALGLLVAQASRARLRAARALITAWTYARTM
eukprot:CAMPEP_0181193386 /NCGR_PEP_ID=MMETSP1096-20121128/13790_1 /TAXON_ID=156174 ORGANISM="Chrysochromulina ericina, Strain CCMP281" /NCGR_SAMPLE_ID=MMETSP1096 /ASSEMBLY_ACC=CAM_ASM_000453 /LENGTH=84 /DNA_ID=CAMNT_0023282847 /DNA_START=190 /DNA_END=444 /DNA_ORIENTATION=-